MIATSATLGLYSIIPKIIELAKDPLGRAKCSMTSQLHISPKYQRFHKKKVTRNEITSPVISFNRFIRRIKYNFSSGINFRSHLQNNYTFRFQIRVKDFIELIVQLIFFSIILVFLCVYIYEHLPTYNK